MLICNDLHQLQWFTWSMKKALPKAETCCEYEMEELVKLDSVEESFDKIYDDLFETNKILHKVFLCPWYLNQY